MTLSTHVLDTARGAPAGGIAVTLARAGDDGWTDLAAGHTDADGRLHDWVSEVDLTAGRYALRFAVGDYLGAGAFFPVVTVEFEVADTGRHYHVPLLLSPYGYTTYLGS